MRAAFLAFILVLAAGPASGQLSFTYTDSPGTGFFDTTPRAPVGGNPGTTLGAQRRNVLIRAGEIWSEYLEFGGPVLVSASFSQETCSTFSGVLAFAGPTSSQRNFPGAPLPNTTYPAALVNHLSGTDRFPGQAEIVVGVNSLIDSSPTCLGGRGFYYGYDGQAGLKTDLLPTLVHELGHGLGFVSFVNEATGAQAFGVPDAFSRNLRDLAQQRDWPQMTNAQRAASAVNEPFVVWTGENTNAAAPFLLEEGFGGTELQIIANDGSVERFAAGGAVFGPDFPEDGVTGLVVPVDDGVPPISDGCEGPFVNASAIAGNIALIDRGSCLFVEKVARAQAAGAIAVVIANNISEQLILMGGEDPAIDIPSLMVTRALGQRLRNENPPVRLGRFGPAGTIAGQVQMHAPDPVDSGSSISHWSTLAFPDLLMEPFLGELPREDPDLSLTAMREMGWTVRNIPFPNLTYAIWASDRIEGPLVGRDQDADGDGVTNFIEYVTATDPMDPGDAEPLQLMIDDGVLSFRGSSQPTDVTYIITESDDLLEFEPATGLDDLGTILAEEAAFRFFGFETEGDRRFFRLEVE